MSSCDYITSRSGLPPTCERCFGRLWISASKMQSTYIHRASRTLNHVFSCKFNILMMPPALGSGRWGHGVTISTALVAAPARPCVTATAHESGSGRHVARARRGSRARRGDRLPGRRGICDSILRSTYSARLPCVERSDRRGTATFVLLAQSA